MVFDAHLTRVPIAWIITSHQTCNSLVEWLTPLKTKLLRNSPKWKPSCFIVNNVAQELWALRWIWFSFYFFLSFYVHVTISKLHSAFSIIDHVISWNKNKLVFYAWLGWCGARIKCPFTFAHGTSQRFGVYVQWKKIKDNGVWHVIYYDFHIIMYMLIELGENIETFMTCGRNKIIENFTRHFSWTRYFWTYCCQLSMWINFQSLIVVPPCCEYSKISIVWIKVETPMIQTTHVGIVYFIVNLWMVGLWRVPHSNQDT